MDNMQVVVYVTNARLVSLHRIRITIRVHRASEVPVRINIQTELVWIVVLVCIQSMVSVRIVLLVTLQQVQLALRVLHVLHVQLASIR